jgi:peroxiredoxin
VNVSWDKDASARKFVDDARFPFPVGRDSSGTVAGAYRVDATPASFFIDKQGVLVESVDGEFPVNAEGEFSRRIEKLLAQ